LRVRPRPGNTAPTIPEPLTQTHSCTERSQVIFAGRFAVGTLPSAPWPARRELVGTAGRGYSEGSRHRISGQDRFGSLNATEPADPGSQGNDST
jgi:hypothetical protein